MTTDTPTNLGDATLHTDPPHLRPAAWTGVVRLAWPVAVALLVAAVVSTVVRGHLNGYQANLLADCGIAIVMAVSLTVVNGFTGQFSIGHSGFLSLGGYAAAAIMYYATYRLFGDFKFHGGLLSWNGLGERPTAWLTAAVNCLFLPPPCFSVPWWLQWSGGWSGLPSLRLRGDYLGDCDARLLRDCPHRVAGQTGTQLQRGRRLRSGEERPDWTSSPASGNLGDGSLAGQMTHLGGALGFSQACPPTPRFFGLPSRPSS